MSNVILGQGWAGDELGVVSIAPFVLMAFVVGLAGVGSGLVMPASNNAAMDLLPEQAGVISGMRGVFRSTGGILGTAAIVVILSLSEDQAAGLRMAFTVYGIVLLAAIPLTLLIPEMPRQSRTGSDRSVAARGRDRPPPTRRAVRRRPPRRSPALTAQAQARPEPDGVPPIERPSSHPPRP